MKFCVFLQIFILGYFKETYSQSEFLNKSICGPETELRLTSSGQGSYIILNLEPTAGQSTGTCKLRILAPDTHIVHLKVLQEDTEEVVEKKNVKNCLLSVYLPENRRTAVWRSDPCTEEMPSEAGLFTHQLRLVWNIPTDKKHVRGRKIVLTAVGQGAICESEKQHPCLKIGWKVLMCISEELVCDGIPQCPRGATENDEDHEICRSKKILNQASWEKIAQEFFKKFTGKNKNGAMIPAMQTDESVKWTFGKELLQMNATEKSSRNRSRIKSEVVYDGSASMETISSALSQYGPWGYLLFGMLLCGTVLMFCGLWECCCRSKKHSNNPLPPSTPVQAPQSTTVLIINPGAQTGDEAQQAPPNYEELDQPPSYTALFPPKNTLRIAHNATRND